MLNQYELMVIFTPILSDDDAKRLADQYVSFITDNGGEIVHTESWGLRQLAYPIDKKTTGIYQLYEFKAPGTLIGDMEIQFKRDDQVMRFLFTRLDKYGVAWNERRREKMKESKAPKTEPAPAEEPEVAEVTDEKTEG
jgi:small subunit ribosomal protein S6